MTDDQEKKDLLQSYWDALDALDEADSALSRCGARLLRLCGPCDREE